MHGVHWGLRPPQQALRAERRTRALPGFFLARRDPAQDSGELARYI